MDSAKIQPVPENLVPVKQITSEQWKLNARDFAKGAIVAIITAVSVTLIDVANDFIANNLVAFDWKLVVKSALAGFVGYLAKQFTDKTKTVRIYDTVKTPTSPE